MNKKFIFITLCVLLSGCMDIGKRASVSATQSSGSESQQSEHALSQHWIGRYSLYVKPEAIMDDASNIGVGYGFEIRDSIVSFVADGFQTYFECECSLQEGRDQLILFYKKTTECATPVPFQNVGDTVAVITCEQGKYYMQSPVVPDAEWAYNKKFLLEKTSLDTSGEPDDDSIPKITYWHENFEYGNEDDCLDRWVSAIDEAEFSAALTNYKNMQIDSTVQLSVTKEGYVVPLENGNSRILFDNYEQSDGRCIYQYKGYLAQINCYVFEYEGFEWEGLAYIPEADGKECLFQTEALFSPDHKNCYCIDATTESGDERIGVIKVFQISPVRIEFMFGLWSDKIFPQTVCWQDNTTLYMKALREEDGADEIHYYKISLDQVR